MWITIISIVIPILLKLFEYLRDKNAKGISLSDRERRIVNKLNKATHGVRVESVMLGCVADGADDEVVTTAITVAKAPSYHTPLTMEQFIELQRLLALGDKATQAEWDAFEATIKE